MDKPAALTTFVQADTSSFRALVQRLTGLPAEADTQQSPKSPSNDGSNEGAAPKVAGIKRSTTSKLLERRQYMMSKIEIGTPGFQNKQGAAILQHSNGSIYTTELVFSPSEFVKFSFTASPLGTPSKAFSNLSLTGGGGEEEEATMVLFDLESEEEEKAIKQRRFYLHSSPRCRPGNAQPELLHLFPLTSPKNVS